jgi:hypothetical protein
METAETGVLAGVLTALSTFPVAYFLDWLSLRLVVFVINPRH